MPHGTIGLTLGCSLKRHYYGTPPPCPCPCPCGVSDPWRQVCQPGGKPKRIKQADLKQGSFTRSLVQGTKAGLPGHRMSARASEACQATSRTLMQLCKFDPNPNSKSGLSPECGSNPTLNCSLFKALPYTIQVRQVVSTRTTSRPVMKYSVQQSVSMLLTASYRLVDTLLPCS